MLAPVEPNWALEWLKIAQGLFGTLIGGALVLLGSWLSDRRKERTEKIAQEQRERALLTGMFAVRNHVMARLNEYEEDGGLLSQLQPLRTAQSYVHRLIDRAPSESESLMIAVIEMGLKLDALLATIDRKKTEPALADAMSFAKVLSVNVEELLQSLEQFDLVTMTQLQFLSEEDLARFKIEPEIDHAPH